ALRTDTRGARFLRTDAPYAKALRAACPQTEAPGAGLLRTDARNAAPLPSDVCRPDPALSPVAASFPPAWRTPAFPRSILRPVPPGTSAGRLAARTPRRRTPEPRRSCA